MRTAKGSNTRFGIGLQVIVAKKLIREQKNASGFSTAPVFRPQRPTGMTSGNTLRCIPLVLARTCLYVEAMRLLPAAALTLCLALSTNGADTLLSGFARTDITPDRPVTLAGYASRKELSQGVHDGLAARVIAFQQGQNRLVLLSTDNLGFYGGTAEPVRAAILQECGLNPGDLFLCAIHTHSAPSLSLDPERGHPNNVAYTRGLQEKLVALTKTALERLVPVQFGPGSGSSPVGVNRRELVRKPGEADRIVLGRNPGGPCDPEVQLLKVVPVDQGKPGAVLFAYATHSTSLGPKNLLISGDIHGVAEDFAERQLPVGWVAAGFAGASGDIDPWFRVLPGFNTNNGWIPETVLMGTMLGQEVVQVADRTLANLPAGPIRTAFKKVELPRKALPDGGSDSTAGLNVTVARVGDVAFVGLGGEIFSQVGKAIKAGSPFGYTFIFTHCNGTAGYLPTTDSYKDGGYEIQSSMFGAGAAEKLVEATLAMLRGIKAAE